MRKWAFAYAKTKTQNSFAVTAKLISAFVFATSIVQSLFFLDPKFQASSHLLCVYSSVCVIPGRKLRKPVFSQRGSNMRSSVSRSLKMALRSLVNYLAHKKKLTHECCFTPNMLPVAISP